MPVTILDAWLADGTYATQDASFSPSAGSNRLVLIGVSAEKNGSGPMAISAVNLGDKALTPISEDNVGSSTAYHNLCWLGYLKESDIASRVGNTITITYSNAPDNPFDEPKVHYACYQDVDQTSPIADNSSFTNESASTIQPGSVAVSDDDKVVVFFVLGQPNTPSPPTGYTEETEQIGASNGHSSSANQRTATTSSTENPTMTASASTRLAVAAAVLRFATAVVTQTHQMML